MKPTQRTQLEIHCLRRSSKKCAHRCRRWLGHFEIHHLQLDLLRMANARCISPNTGDIKKVSTTLRVCCREIEADRRSSGIWCHILRRTVVRISWRAVRAVQVYPIAVSQKAKCRATEVDRLTGNRVHHRNG